MEEQKANDKHIYLQMIHHRETDKIKRI